jgi:hypothetical protein
MYSMLQKFPKEFNLRRLFILNTSSLEINFCVYKQANSIGVPCEFRRHSTRISSVFYVPFLLYCKAELHQVKDIMKTHV